jgi:uncharacterized protein with HEPN domain
MPPEVLKLLLDIEQACGLIEQFTAEKTVDDLRQDAKLRSAVERQFITIGESLQQAIRLLPDLSSSIAESRRVINFRNVMVHGYAQIVPDTVWGVVEKDLPVLHAEVRHLISSGSPSTASKDE